VAALQIIDQAATSWLQSIPPPSAKLWSYPAQSYAATYLLADEGFTISSARKARKSRLSGTDSVKEKCRSDELGTALSNAHEAKIIHPITFMLLP
jgi:hypothetical protein